jgi:hypothetical protein
MLLIHFATIFLGFEADISPFDLLSYVNYNSSIVSAPVRAQTVWYPLLNTCEIGT